MYSAVVSRMYMHTVFVSAFDQIVRISVYMQIVSVN